MWDDRFLFVTGSLAAIALWISFDLSTSDRKSGRYGVLSWLTRRSVLAVIILIIGGRLWLYRQDLSFPTAGSIIAILIGAVFGSFAAKFIRSLFGADFGRRDPIIGACVLVLLSVAYSLPLYSRAISGFLSGIGLSAIKTPILELSLRENPGGRGTITSVSGASGAQFTAQAVPRASDPSPGLGWLDLDTHDDCPKEKGCTLDTDKEYIKFLEYDDPPPKTYSDVLAATKAFLLPAETLSRCLVEYVKIVPDSQLLVVDVKPVIQSLFKLHAKAKRELESKAKQQPKSNSQEPMAKTGEAHADLAPSVQEVLGKVNEYFGSEPDIEKECKKELVSLENKTAATENKDIEFYYSQPYGALVLADLLVAHGAPDEAIRVLAEWLNFWEKPYAKPRVSPDWFRLRVASRLALLMKNLAGQNNIAYREFFQYYKQQFEEYASRSQKHPQQLDQYPETCKSWTTLSKNNAAAANLEIEKKVYYLLLANEDEQLRTQISFLSEENNFEALEKLVRRARFMASIGPDCLPSALEYAYRKGIIADHQVTAGLLGLTVADRMASIARSSGDRERARDIRRVAEDQLRTGWDDLRPIVIDEREKNEKNPWSDRIFGQSRWESSASLANRALFQLRSGDY